MSLVRDIEVYIHNNYGPNEPILLSELETSSVSTASIRQQVKKLLDDGTLNRYDKGIYYMPTDSIFKSGSTLSIDDVIKKKYLMDNENCCGYVGGMLFANKLGLTSQVPSVYEVTTNKATTDYRETTIADFRIILRKPYYTIDKNNIQALQFLDLMKDISNISELEGSDLSNRLFNYMKSKDIKFEDLKPFLQYYPDKIYKNMYEVGILNGISS